MKKFTLITLTAIFILIAPLFINIGNASNQTTYAIQSFGKITNDEDYNLVSPKVIVRHLGNPMPDWTNDIDTNVDWWVENHSWVKGGAVIIDVEDIAPILWFNQAGYEGYKFNTTHGTWSSTGWTFIQLRQLIDRFHYNNVSVILGIIGFAKSPTASCWSSNIWGWIYNNHPELFFLKDNNEYFGVSNGDYSFPAPINWFAKFSSEDNVSGAIKEENIVNLFNRRLKEMINSGLEWDGIFGSEGWGSVGSWGQTIDASYQLTTEYGKWTTLELPTDWEGMTGIQRLSWIKQDVDYQKDFGAWAGYMYAANVFKPMHDTIKSIRESSGFFVGLLFSPDQSWQDRERNSEWGGWSQNVGYNSTYLAEYCSESTYIYWVNQEVTDWSQTMAQQQAYTSAIIKASNPKFNVVIGLHTLINNGQSAPIEWLYKEYLAQICNFIWINGQRYSAVNSNTIVIQYPNNASNWGYFSSELNKMFDYIKNTNLILLEASPVNIGPTYVITSTQKTYGDQAWSSLNYTFLQWVTTDNLSNNSKNLNWDMNTLYFPEREIQERGDQLLNIQDSILKGFANGSLSIIVNSETVYSDCGILEQLIFSGTSTTNCLSTFHVSGPSVWKSDNSTKIVNQNNEDSKWIVGNYTGNIYSPSADKWYSQSQAFNLRGYYSGSGFIEISKFESGLIQYGIYQNSSSGKFLYVQYQQMLPPDMINRGIQWTTELPIKSSEALLEMVVYSTEKGLAIPMWNMKNNNRLSFDLSIDENALGLTSVNDYIFSWASKPSVKWTESSWYNLSILTLEQGADILIINHK